MTSNLTHNAAIAINNHAKTVALATDITLDSAREISVDEVAR